MTVDGKTPGRTASTRGRNDCTAVIWSYLVRILFLGRPTRSFGRADVRASLGRHRTFSDEIAAANYLRAGNRDDGHGLGLAGLESHGRSRGDVETHAVGPFAIEHECAIGLDEVIVAPDLNRPIAGVGDLKTDALAPVVRDDLALAREDLARHAVRRGRPARARCNRRRHGQETSVERELEVPVLRDNRMMHGHELRAIGERAFHLDFVHELGHPVHHVRAAEELPPDVHQLGDRPAVADEFENLGRDERHRFGLVQAHATREAFLCQRAGLMQR